MWTPDLLKKFQNGILLGDIENSFHEVTHMGLEPHHCFLFEISQHKRWLQETFKFFAKMGRWRYGRNFFGKFAQIHAKHML